MSAAEPMAAAAAAGSCALTEHPLGALEKALQDSAETLNALALGVHAFRYDGQQALYDGVNQLVRDLREMERAAAAVDAAVPVDVLEAIDRGRNPELCTYEMLESAAEASAAARGKLDCMATFRLAMEREMRREGIPIPSDEEIRAAQMPLGEPAGAAAAASGGGAAAQGHGDLSMSG
jgi:Transcription factor subunit Med10 of Mediator complex